MRRRAFFGFLGGAAASGPALAKVAADHATLRQAGFSMGSEVACASPTSAAPASAGAVSKFIRWVKRSGIPAWKMHELRRQADYQRQYGFDPDLASLVSVSPSFKARTQRQRNLDRLIETSLASVGRNSERHKFDEKIRAQFGDGLDWYD